jgi:hypothetical protein
VFNFGRPNSPGQWLAHIMLAIVALFLIWWLLHIYAM